MIRYRFILPVVTFLYYVPAQAQTMSRPTSDGNMVLEGTIVKIDDDDIFLDIAGDSVHPGLKLIVYRNIVIHHPVTQKKLSDQFPIGTLEINQLGNELSIARLHGKAKRPFQVGDTVASKPVYPKRSTGLSSQKIPKPSKQPPPKEVPITCPPCQESARGKQDSEILVVWKATLGKPPEERIRLYKVFIQRNPNYQNLDVVRQEIAFFRSHMEKEKSWTKADLLQKDQTQKVPTIADKVRVEKITVAYQGKPVQIAAWVKKGSDLRSLIFHIRKKGTQKQYRSFLMTMDGRGHARVQVPDEFLEQSGFEYWIEKVDKNGYGSPIFESSEKPNFVEVISDIEEIKSDQHRVRLRFNSEYISFDRLSGRDYAWINEGDFLYRLRLFPLNGIRIGYGHYRGKGGTVEHLDRLKLDPISANFTYGFVETEFRLHRLFGVAARGKVGLGRPEFSGDERQGITGGFQLCLRIGSEEETHLLLSGEITPELGQQAFIGLAWEAFMDWPMAAEVHLTDQPINSDELAVRLVFELGYQINEQFALSTRTSVQGRTFSHTGPGFGLAATFDW